MFNVVVRGESKIYIYTSIFISGNFQNVLTYYHIGVPIFRVYTHLLSEKKKYFVKKDLRTTRAILQ